MLYSALHHAKHVKNLIVLGSPIDSYASGRIGKLYRFVHNTIQKIRLLSVAFMQVYPKN